MRDARDAGQTNERQTSEDRATQPMEAGDWVSQKRFYIVRVPGFRETPWQRWWGKACFSRGRAACFFRGAGRASLLGIDLLGQLKNYFWSWKASNFSGYWDPVTCKHDAQYAKDAVNKVCLAAENRDAVNFNLRETDSFCLRRNLKAPTRCQVCRYCTSSATGKKQTIDFKHSNILKQKSRSLPRPNLF